MNRVCDVIIPVHNQPQWVSLCVEELLRTTPHNFLGRVLLVDDRSNAATLAEIGRVSTLHSSIRTLSNTGDRGFAATVNRGLEESTADYVFLLNTDCLLTAGAIPKLIAHCESEPRIGLISPFSNNSPPLTVPMLPGFSYPRMNAAVEEHFRGVWMEACTIVGNALLITRECLNRTGPLDPSYGLGYGEETDYQFRAMANGFLAVAALDTYVYHQGAESFGTDPIAMSRARGAGRKLFFQRWGKTFSSYSERVPPERAAATVQGGLAHIEARGATAMFVLPGLLQRIGGCHVVVDICNGAARRGEDIQLAVLQDRSRLSWGDPMFFEPIFYRGEVEFATDRRFSPKVIVATAWNTAAPAMLRANATGAQWHYFVQGYEFYFEHGRIYRSVEETFKHATHLFTTSQWLKDMLAVHFPGHIECLPAGFDERLFNTEGRSEEQLPAVTVVLRGSIDKGQPFLMDLLHRLAKRRGQIALNLIVAGNPLLPSAWMDQSRVYTLPLRRNDLAAVLKRTNILVDASLHEGFGLLPLEALACGAAVVVSSSGGIADFVSDGNNGFIVHEVNNPVRYLERLDVLLDDPALLARMQQCAASSVEQFKSKNVIPAYCEYLTKAAEAAPSRKRPLSGSFALLSMADTAQRVSLTNPGLSSSEYADDGSARDRLRHVEQELAAMQNSRIWRTLCAGGSLLMHASGVFRHLAGAVSRRSRRGGA